MEDRLKTGIQVAPDQLRQFIERLEYLEDEKRAVVEQIKEVFDEAGETGFDKRILREVLKVRRQDKEEREEREAILSLYLDALGMK